MIEQVTTEELLAQAREDYRKISRLVRLIKSAPAFARPEVPDPYGSVVLGDWLDEARALVAEIEAGPGAEGLR